MARAPDMERKTHILRLSEFGNIKCLACVRNTSYLDVIPGLRVCVEPFSIGDSNHTSKAKAGYNHKMQLSLLQTRSPRQRPKHWMRHSGQTHPSQWRWRRLTSGRMNENTERSHCSLTDRPPDGGLLTSSREVTSHFPRHRRRGSHASRQLQ